MSLVCSTLTWFLGQDPMAAPAKKQSTTSDDDFLSFFGGASQTTQPKKAPINRKRVYTSLNAKDIREVQLNLKKSKHVFLIPRARAETIVCSSNR